MNVIARSKLELAYFVAAVKHLRWQWFFFGRRGYIRKNPSETLKGLEMVIVKVLYSQNWYLPSPSACCHQWSQVWWNQFRRISSRSCWRSRARRAAGARCRRDVLPSGLIPQFGAGYGQVAVGRSRTLRRADSRPSDL